MKKPFLIWMILLLNTAGLYAQRAVCPDTVKLSIDTSFLQQELLVRVNVKGFKDIISLQTGMRYDRDVFKLQEVTSTLPDFASDNWVDDGDGELRILWNENSGLGYSLNDDSTLFTLRFSVIQQGSTSFIGISTRKYPLEFINTDFALLCAEPAVIAASGNGIKLSGKVVYDNNNNCLGDTDEAGVQGLIIEISGNGNTFYRKTDKDGTYSIILPQGNYRLLAYNNQDPWTLCETEINADFPVDRDDLNFVLRKQEPCYKIITDISTPLLQRCAPNTYTLIYRNLGTEQAENATIEVLLDRDMSFVSADFNDFSVSGDLITFFLGNLAPGDGGTIHITCNLSCNTISGQTHCLTATAFPNDPCEPVPGWTGARLALNASCDPLENKVRFVLRNVGTGPMTSSRNYIVTEDDVLSPPEPVLLDEGEEVVIDFPADGKTYRVTADQDNGFPFLSKFITRAVEGCTTQSGGQFSTGFVTMFEESDRDLFVDTDCRESLILPSKANMLGMPKGYGPEKFISRDYKLEYLISYRHTGSDTIQKVIIKNRIPDSLDITTLRLGTSSHPYKYRLNHQRELWVEFDSVALIDTGVADTFAGVFIKYSINPLPTIPDGYRIINEASMYLDLEEKQSTGPEVHTIGTDFVMTGIDWEGGEVAARIFPNPVAEAIFIELPEGQQLQAIYEITDAMGKTAGGGTLMDGDASIAVSWLSSGHYILTIRFADGRKAKLKLIKW
jgi:hypothetical protein